jgi:circadian clock protein KaiC
LSIIKSRGMGHSNQVRELVLSAAGVTLADTYMSGGEVLMGTLRWEKERAESSERAEAESTRARQRVEVENAETELAAKIRSLQRELEEKRAEKNVLDKSATNGAAELSQNKKLLRGLRKADQSGPEKRYQ